MQIWAESGKSALPICNYSQILYQFLTFTQNLKRSLYPVLRFPLGLVGFSPRRYLPSAHRGKRPKSSACKLP